MKNSKNELEEECYQCNDIYIVKAKSMDDAQKFCEKHHLGRKSAFSCQHLDERQLAENIKDKVVIRHFSNDGAGRSVLNKVSLDTLFEDFDFLGVTQIVDYLTIEKDLLKNLRILK